MEIISTGALLTTSRGREENWQDQGHQHRPPPAQNKQLVVAPVDSQRDASQQLPQPAQGRESLIERGEGQAISPQEVFGHHPVVGQGHVSTLIGPHRSYLFRDLYLFYSPMRPLIWLAIASSPSLLVYLHDSNPVR